MKRFLREPLVHFLAIGTALFLAFAWKGGAGRASGRIVVTRARIESLGAGFQRMEKRPPTPEEMKGLIAGYVREEAAVREAMATGLDRDDTIIRRRLKQKIDFFAEDRADSVPSTEADLAASADRRKRELDALYERLLAKTTVVIESAPEKK
jgi:hypothetical protein